MSNDGLNELLKLNNNRISFLQLNLGHRLWAHEALMAWLSGEKKIWILCLQEPYVGKKGMTKLPREYGAYWINHESNDMETTKKRARAAIIAPRDMKGYLITQASSIDIVSVRFDMLNIYVISGYFAGDKNISEIVNYMISDIYEGKEVLCCVDSNAYHSRWGSNLKRNQKWSARKRGEILQELLDEKDYVICNQTPHMATFIRDSVVKDESHIDITFCTRNTYNRIEEWMVKDETFLSDHRVIQFELQYELVQIKQVNRVENRDDIPWKKPNRQMEMVMSAALQNSIKGKYKIESIQDVDNSIESHTQKIRQVLGKVFKQKQRQVNKVYWWTEDVAREYKKLRLARRRMRRYNHLNLKEEFRRTREIFREVVKKAKIDAWKTFTSGIGDPWSKLIKVIKATATGKILSRTLHDIHGVYATDMEGTLKMLSRQFFPEPEALEEVHLAIENEVKEKLKEQRIGPKITACELKEAVKQLSSSSALGFDKVTNNVIRCLLQKSDVEQYYLKLFNYCLTQSYFPTSWKLAKVVLIPKPTSESNSTKAFRPISLTSNLAKLYERIILARLLHYLSLSNQQTLNQHAYKKGRSTQTALYELFDVVQYGLHRRGGEKSVCVVVFLDISGAFDKTWHSGILYKLLEYKVPVYLVKFLKNFLEGRKAIFMDSDVTHEVHLMQGCPQGGVLSPLLWNVLFNEFLDLPTYCGGKRHNRLKVIGYADDAAIICKASNVEEASEYINLHLAKISAWAKKYRVQFNAAKLAAMTISNRLKKPSPTAIFYNGIRIKEVTEYKYLGLTVDSKCTWKPHITNVLQKLSLVTRSLRGLSGHNWGINLNIFRMLYHAIFMPVMTYGIAIWGWKAVSKQMCIKFDQQIRCFGLLATRCLKSTSSTFIFNLLKTQPFSKIVEFQVLKISVQQFQVVDSKRKQVYENYRSKRISRIVPQCVDHHFFICRQTLGLTDRKLTEIKFENINKQYSVHPAKWVDVDIRIDLSVIANWVGVENCGWILFTDASKSTHGTGWGLAVFKNNFCVFRSSGALSDCSIFTAEAYAILQALKFVQTINVDKRAIEIRTDAQAVCHSLRKQQQSEELLQLIMEELRKAYLENKKVVIRWIPSHHDIYGNTTVDKMAKRATDKRIRTEMAITNRDIKNFLNEKQLAIQNNLWESYSSKNVKTFLPDLSSIACFLNSNPSSSLCQIVSGHSCLNEFVCQKLGLIISPKCRCTLDNETVTHFLLECPLYDEIRNEIWPDFVATYDFILKDWKLVDRYVMRTQRFKKNVRERLIEEVRK